MSGKRAARSIGLAVTSLHTCLKLSPFGLPVITFPVAFGLAVKPRPSRAAFLDATTAESSELLMHGRHRQTEQSDTPTEAVVQPGILADSGLAKRQLDAIEPITTSRSSEESSSVSGCRI